MSTLSPTNSTDSTGAAKTRRRPVAATGRFLGEVGHELSQVTWPTAKQTGVYTLVVIAFLIVMVALIGGADALIATVMLRLFG